MDFKQSLLRHVYMTLVPKNFRLNEAQKIVAENGAHYRIPKL